MRKIVKSIVIISFILLVLAGIFFLFFRNRHTKIEGLPIEVSKFLTQEDIDNLEELEYPIYFGLNPPNIGGSYLANNQRIDYDKMNPRYIGSLVIDTIESFHTQTEDLKIVMDSEHVNTGIVREGDVGYMSGEDNCFTVFNLGTTKEEFGCVTNSAIIVSGCIDEEGNIEGFKKSIMMLKHNSRILCVIIPKALNQRHPIQEGNIRIISEVDGVAERVE